MSALSISTHSAASITRALSEDGHKLWGFVIYRGTYKDDEKWKAFVDRFHSEVKRQIQGDEGEALLEKLDITVLEDVSWEDASTATIRAHFHAWCEENAPREQGIEFASEQRYWRGWRYNFCIYMNSTALGSFDKGADTKEFAILILSPWLSIRDQPELLVEKRPKPSWWKQDWPLLPKEHPELEGNKEEDVGWMMMELSALVPMYTFLRPWDSWRREYQRPPIVATD